MHLITVVQFILVAKHTIINDVDSHPKTMSLVKCGHACYMDTTCVSFFYEPILQKCYLSSRYIQIGNEHTTGAFSYYRKQNLKGVEEECHKKGHRYTNIGDLCYRDSTTMKSWVDAQRDCEKLNGTLFNIDSPEKHDFFARVVRMKTDNGKRFIGASRPNESGAWTWTDGRNIEQSYWLPNEPDYIPFVPQNCVQYEERDMKYLWDNTQCMIAKHYYCHYP